MHDRWLNGAAPKDIAPLCYPLAWRKNQTVQAALNQKSWMKRVRRMTNTTQITQFVDLWQQLRGIQLSSQPDQIQWRFSADDRYSSRSAYMMQFKGSIQDYLWDKVWKTKVENKCKFFLWLLLQRKLLTVDRIIKRGEQANPVCQLCKTRNESMTHMVANCSYSDKVWQLIAQETEIRLPPTQHGTFGKNNVDEYMTTRR